MFDTLHRWLLFVLCRYCQGWWGMWRLDLSRRIMDYRFSTAGPLLVRTKWGLPIEVRKNDLIGHVLYFFGDIERKLRAAAAAELSPGDAALDIGANIGAVSLFLGSRVGRKGRVFCIEPLAENFAMLRRNLERVDFGGIFCAEHCALGSEEKTVSLHFHEQMDNSGTVSLLDDTGDAVQPVVMRRLDTLWEEWGRPPLRFVKMDVEGYEYEVMRGAERLLREAPPKVWVVEFHWEHLSRIKNGVRRQWDIFLQHGYEPFSIATGGKMTQPPEAHCDVLSRLKAV